MADDIILTEQGIHIAIQYANAKAAIAIQGTSYNPDIIDDLTNRLCRLWTTTLTSATTNGYQFPDPPIEDDDDPDDDE